MASADAAQLAALLVEYNAHLVRCGFPPAPMRARARAALAPFCGDEACDGEERAALHRALADGRLDDYEHAVQERAAALACGPALLVQAEPKIDRHAQFQDVLRGNEERLKAHLDLNVLANEARCGRPGCGSSDLRYTTEQRRSADEGMDVEVVCNKCQWKRRYRG